MFYYNRVVLAGKKNTLPFLTSQWIDDLMASYEPIFSEGRSIGSVVEALKESAKKDRRIEMETAN
mgnify:CR=1 FL=1